MYRDNKGKYIPRSDPRAVFQAVRHTREVEAAHATANRRETVRARGYNGALTRDEYSRGYGRPTTLVRRKSVR